MPAFVRNSPAPSATSSPAPVPGRAYALGIATVLTACLLLVWTTIVRDGDDAGAIFMVILAAGVGAFAARFAARGMARAMAGVAAMQLALGLLTATAPITATLPEGVAMALFYHGFFAALWLIAATCFWKAARDYGPSSSCRIAMSLVLERMANPTLDTHPAPVLLWDGSAFRHFYYCYSAFATVNRPQGSQNQRQQQVALVCAGDLCSTPRGPSARRGAAYCERAELGRVQ